MKLLLSIIANGLRKWRYFQELKELSTLAAIAIALWFFKTYGITLLKLSVTEEGQICVMFSLATFILALTLNMFYRIMVIKYHEKSTDIELFKFLNEKN